MPFGVQEVENIGLAEGIGVRQFGADLRHFDSEKEIAFAILAGACFEETSGDGRLGRCRGLA
jgi:hypothetical protein